MARKKEEKKEREQSLLQRLCEADDQLYGFLSRYLYEDPLAAIPEKALDTLINQANKSEDYRSAMDKAIFEASQSPGEKERYINLIQDLASKAMKQIDKEKQEMEQEGHEELANCLGKIIDNYQLISNRTEDIIEIASKFYKERLLEVEEEARLGEIERGRKETKRRDRREKSEESRQRERE
jgi:hypothetical protein